MIPQGSAEVKGEGRQSSAPPNKHPPLLPPEETREDVAPQAFVAPPLLGAPCILGCLCALSAGEAKAEGIYFR